MEAINDAGFLQDQFCSKSSCPAAGSSTVFEDARNVGSCEQLPLDIERGWKESLQFFPGVTADVLEKQLAQRIHKISQGASGKRKKCIKQETRLSSVERRICEEYFRQRMLSSKIMLEMEI